MNFGFFRLGVKELVLVLAIVLIIFGPKRLPDIGRSFGQTLRSFRKGSQEPDPKAGEDESKGSGSGDDKLS